MSIKDYRLRNNLTQEEVARALNIVLNHYQKIEYGKTIPNVKIGLKLARILEVDPYELFPVDDEE